MQNIILFPCLMLLQKSHLDHGLYPHYLVTLVACCVTKCQEVPIRLAQIWHSDYRTPGEGDIKRGLLNKVSANKNVISLVFIG
jgi:hypothetical protein